jgi:hypothetical protein
LEIEVAARYRFGLGYVFLGSGIGIPLRLRGEIRGSAAVPPGTLTDASLCAYNVAAAIRLIPTIILIMSHSVRGHCLEMRSSAKLPVPILPPGIVTDNVNLEV